MSTAEHGVWRLRKTDLRKKTGKAGPQLDTKEKKKRDEKLYCSACAHPISSESERVAVSGGHEHHFRNPAGIQFHIGCFYAAPGCVAFGPAVEEHTWFPGYSWRVVLCRNCMTHLGWLFLSLLGEKNFHGLILDRLRRPS